MSVAEIAVCVTSVDQVPAARLSAWVAGARTAGEPWANRHDRLRRPVDRSTLALARLVASAMVPQAVGSWTVDCRPVDCIVRQRCPSCGGQDHGVPEVAGLAGLSWSRSGDVVAVAVCAAARVGVDVERLAAGTPTRSSESSESSVLPAGSSSGFPAGSSARSSAAARGAYDVLPAADLADARARGVDPAEIWATKEALIKLGVTDLDESLRVPLAALATRLGIGGVELWRVMVGGGQAEGGEVVVALATDGASYAVRHVSVGDVFAHPPREWRL